MPNKKRILSNDEVIADIESHTDESDKSFYKTTSKDKTSFRLLVAPLAMFILMNKVEFVKKKMLLLLSPRN